MLVETNVSDDIRCRFRAVLSEVPITYMQMQSESGINRTILSRFLNNDFKKDIHVKTRSRIEKYVARKEKELRDIHEKD